MLLPSAVLTTFVTLPTTLNTTTTTTTMAATATGASTAPPSTTAYQCDMQYCDGSTSWCFYWAGVTSWDANDGPRPGEVRTQLGLCSPVTVTVVPDPAATSDPVTPDLGR